MIDVLGALMGIDMQGFSRDEGSDVLPPGVKEEEAAYASQSTSSPPPAPSASTSKPTPKPATDEDVEMDDEDARAKKESELEKQTGAAAYKARDFPKAAEHFAKAWEVWPKDVTYLTNLGGELSAARQVIHIAQHTWQPCTSSRVIMTSVLRPASKPSRRDVR